MLNKHSWPGFFFFKERKMLITAAEAAKLLAVTRARLYMLVRENAVPHVRLGERQIRFSEASLKNWIAEQTVGGLVQSNGNGAHHEQRAA
jgi:excisionase family DNA binding protein